MVIDESPAWRDKCRPYSSRSECVTHVFVGLLCTAGKINVSTRYAVITIPVIITVKWWFSWNTELRTTIVSWYAEVKKTQERRINRWCTLLYVTGWAAACLSLSIVQTRVWMTQLHKWSRFLYTIVDFSVIKKLGRMLFSRPLNLIGIFEVHFLLLKKEMSQLMMRYDQ